MGNHHLSSTVPYKPCLSPPQNVHKAFTLERHTHGREGREPSFVDVERLVSGAHEIIQDADIARQPSTPHQLLENSDEKTTSRTVSMDTVGAVAATS